jgi:hypothetical protein
MEGARVVSWFSRRSRREDGGPAEAPEAAAETESPDTPPEEPEAVGPADGGPWDISEVPSRGTRLDLGALWVPVAESLTVRLEWEKKSGRLVAVNVSRDGSNLRMQLFAAPKTTGIWDEIREEMTAAIVRDGGSAEDGAGPFGMELRAKLPTPTRDGRIGKRSIRFVGIDGPRWFLRAEFTGKAATNPQVAEELESVLRDVVIDRGSDAHPPRDLLYLTLPGNAAAQAADGSPKPPKMPGRGPEIAEIR